MGLRTPNLAGEDRRSTLEEREPEAAVHLLVSERKIAVDGQRGKLIVQSRRNCCICSCDKALMLSRR